MAEPPAEEARKGPQVPAHDNETSDDEQSVSGQEYFVERILAEKKVGSRNLYLLKWDGYPEDEATWEPKVHIQHPQLLADWEDRKALERKGLKPRYNVAQWHLRQDEIARGKRIPHDSDGDSSEVEALEIDQQPDDDMGMMPMPHQKRSSVRAPRRSEQEDDDSSSDSPSNEIFVDDKKITKKNAFQALREKRAQRQSATSREQGQSTPRGEETPMFRTASNSSVEVTQHRAPEPLTILVNPLESSPVSSPIPRPIASAARGGIGAATRGGSSLVPKNVFAKRKVIQKQKPNLIETSTDPKNAPKLYGNMRIQYKAQIQARNLADKAPDLEAIGGLYDPSNPSKLSTIRPPTTREASSTVSSRPEPAIERQPIESPTSREPSLPNCPPRPRPDYRVRDGYNAICANFYEWDDCQAGDNCKYKHVDRADLPVVPKFGEAPCIHFLSPKGCVRGDRCKWPHPEGFDLDTPIVSTAIKWSERASTNNTVEPSATNLNVRPPWRQNDYFNGVCFFWHNINCAKGSSCKFHHTYEGNLPMAPPPPGWVGKQPGPDPPPNWRPGEEPDARPSAVSFGTEAPSPDDPFDEDSLFVGSGPNHHKSRPEASALKNSAPASIEHPNSDTTSPTPPRKTVSFMADKPVEVKAESLPADRKQDQSSTSRKVCEYWGLGNCRYGTSCHLEHPISESRISYPPGVNVCLHFLRGECSYGERCFKYHPTPRYLAAIANPSTSDRSTPPCSQRTTTMVNSQASDKSPGESLTMPVSSTNIIRTFDEPLAQALNGEVRSPTIQSPLITQPPSLVLNTNSKINASKRKLTVKEYRRSKTLNTLGHRAMKCYFGSGVQSIVLDFGDITEEALRKPWGDSFSSVTSLRFDQSFVAQDFKAQRDNIQQRLYWQGTLLSSPSGSEALSKLYKQLQIQVGGALATSAEFSVLIYPGIEEWKFLEDSKPISPQLCYIVFQSKLGQNDPLQLSSGPKPANHRKSLVRELHGLSFKRLLPKKVEGKTYHFFLLFPPSANSTASFVTSWIAAAYPGKTKVYSSHTEGSWDFFINNRDLEYGIVLIHESAIGYIGQLPSLMTAISPSGGKTFSFWYINDSSSPYPLVSPPSESTLGQLTAARILPHGTAILLNPSLLVAEPEKALQLIKWFQSTYKTKTLGTWKLVCCHDILDYLLDLALEKAMERAEFHEKHHGLAAKDAIEEKVGLTYRNCAARFACHALISDMLSAKVIEEDDGPIVLAPHNVSQEDEQSLACWFAGWSIVNIDRFRKFVIAGTGPRSSEKATRWRTYFQPVSITAGAKKVGPDQNTSNTGHISPAKLRALEVATKPNKAYPRSGKNPPPTRPDRTYTFDGSADMEMLDVDERGPMDLDQLIAAESAAAERERERGVISPVIEHPYPFNPFVAQNPAFHDLASPQLGTAAEFSAFQFDGPFASTLQARPQSSGSGVSAASLSSGILTDSSGRRVVPRTVRPSGTIRPEIPIKPGYVPPEDKPAYQHPNSREHSRRSSVQSRSGPRLDGMDLDIDMFAQDPSRLPKEEIKFEPTTVWYERLKKEDKLEGGGWEHIYIADFDKVFKFLNVSR